MIQVEASSNTDFEKIESLHAPDIVAGSEGQRLMEAPMADDDERLLAELNAQAQAADEHRDILPNLRALALALAAKYRTAPPMKLNVRQTCGARRLHWRE